MDKDALFDLKQSSGSDSDEKPQIEQVEPLETPLHKSTSIHPSSGPQVFPSIYRAASTVEKVNPPLVKVAPTVKEEELKNADEVEIEFVSPSEHFKEPITLRVKKELTIADVKLLIKDKHAQKPIVKAQKIIYKGRQLTDDIIIGEAMKIGVSGQLDGTLEAKFHLLIDKKAMLNATAAEENKTQAAAARIEAERRINNAFRPVNVAR